MPEASQENGGTARAPRTDRPPRGRLEVAVSAAVLGAAAGFFYFADPATAHGYLPCVFHRGTGLLCPGCGGQRAMHLLLHGGFAAALRANVFAVAVILPLGAAVYARWVMERLGWVRPRPARLTGAVLLGFVAAAVVFAVLRNLPGEMWSVLRP